MMRILSFLASMHCSLPNNYYTFNEMGDFRISPRFLVTFSLQVVEDMQTALPRAGAVVSRGQS